MMILRISRHYPNYRNICGTWPTRKPRRPPQRWRRRRSGPAGSSGAWLDPWLAEKAIPHALTVRIPVPVIRISFLFDAPELIEQHRIGDGELEAVADESVGPL